MWRLLALEMQTTIVSLIVRKRWKSRNRKEIFAAVVDKNTSTRAIVVHCSTRALFHNVSSCCKIFSADKVSLGFGMYVPAILLRFVCVLVRATVHKASVLLVESSWNVMAGGDAREGKWRGNLRMGWVASTLHTTSEHGVSSITTADGALLGCQQSTELTPTGRFKWTRTFRWKTKSGFCACAITFQMQSTKPRPLHLKRSQAQRLHLPF